jgi:hypothetical protein
MLASPAQLFLVSVSSRSMTKDFVLSYVFRNEASDGKAVDLSVSVAP